ncbi:uncharacterized protein LOC121837320 [Ixodes scapularis]|uniref:uncharacterized protein LOC121837320 n=1 Tax=Ixodes scapularis TaxID=6945 RepID=UPI001C3835A7|nr:uncharacterized protein LOC121837320 [Ixodes scapularis]
MAVDRILEKDRLQLILCTRQFAGVKKNLNAAGKSQDCGSIADWAQPAVNHLYWCAAASQGNAELLVDAWCSMTRHVVNIHTDHPGIYTTCFHNPIEEGEWLVPDTPAHARFVDVVTSKSLLKDLRQLSPHTQTYALESFHSVLNGFAPKTRIAALHYNENGNREQATTQAGQKQWKLKSPKARKGHHAAHPEKTKATYGYVTKLLAQAVVVCEEMGSLRQAFELDAEKPDPPCLNQSTDRPPKEDLVAARVSRFARRPPGALLPHQTQSPPQG